MASPPVVPKAKLEGDNDGRSTQTKTASTAVSGEYADWLQLARNSFAASTSYLDTNLREQWERNLRNFNSKHPAGSKYHSESFKHRSRAFRPKTRSMVRQTEAAAAAAFFSTADVVSIAPEDDSQPSQNDAADVMHQLCNYRLRHSIKWFQVCLGALQDTMNYGVVCSHQAWKYRERRRQVREQLVDEYTGMPLFDAQQEPLMETRIEIDVLEDRPNIELIPPENLRISPAADWTDPINSSPYVIHMIPMYITDVLERINTPDRKTGEPPWFRLSKAELFAGQRHLYDSVRQAREGNRRTDSKEDIHGEPDDFSIVWVHRNIFRREGRDWMFYTVGSEVMLSKPVLLESVYLHAEYERPYVMGVCVLETHKTYPAGPVELTGGLQALANEISNQRIDNVRLAMNKQYITRQNENTDYRPLLRSVPGAVIPVANPKDDVIPISTPDVTASSYQEQDRINVDFDDLAGQFSTSSVQSNRSLNETVGGMQLMQGGAAQLTEYLLRMFSETWVEPVLRQLVRMEQKYETDETVILVASRLANVMQFSYAMFEHNLSVSVNVGMGATSPQQKVERFLTGMNATANLIPDAIQNLDREEVIKEIFGQLGYEDGKRFFAEPQPQQTDPAAQMQQMELQLKQMEMQQKATMEERKLAQEREIKLYEIAAKYEITVAELMAKIGLQQQKELNPANVLPQ